MTSFCWILSPTIFLCLAWSLSTKTIFTQSPLSSLSTLLLPGTAFFTMKIEVITWEPLQLSIPAWLTCVLTHLFLFPPDTANNMCFWSIFTVFKSQEKPSAIHPKKGWCWEGTSLENSLFSDTFIKEKTKLKEESQCLGIHIIPKSLSPSEPGTTENLEMMPEWWPNSRYSEL